MAKKNKRIELRFAVQQGKVKFESTGGLFAFLKGWARALPIINISHEGLRLLSRKKLKVGDKLSLNIAIPVLGAQPLATAGKVVWVKTFTIFDEYMVGVKFSGLSVGNKKRLNNLVNFLGMRPVSRPLIINEVKKADRSCVVCKFGRTGQANESLMKIGPMPFA